MGTDIMVGGKINNTRTWKKFGGGILSELYTPRNDGIRLRAFSIQMLEVILLKIHSNKGYVYLECVTKA